MTLPKLRCRWEPARTTLGEPFAPAERHAIWEHAARTAAGASDQIRHLAATDPAAAADAAWAAADTLHAAASALRSRALRQAADSYDRAARAPYGRIPRPTPAGNSLRRAARLLSTAASVSGDPTLAQITLVTRLAALVEDIADLREAQRNAAHAAQPGSTADGLGRGLSDRIASYLFGSIPILSDPGPDVPAGRADPGSRRLHHPASRPGTVPGAPAIRLAETPWSRQRLVRSSRSRDGISSLRPA